MKVFTLCFVFALACLLMLGTSTAVADYNVTVKTSAGVGINGITVNYETGVGTWLNVITNASGIATIPTGRNVVKANYNLSSTGWVNTGGVDITFYTTTVTARVLNCGNAVVPGASFRYNPGATEGGTWLTANPIELFAGQWYVAADIYGHVRNAQTPTVAGTNTAAGQTLTVTFKTVKVTGGFGSVYCDPSPTGRDNYFRVGPFTPAAGVELLPGSYYFKNNSTNAHYTSGTIVGPYAIGTGCTFILPHKVTVKTSAGVGIPNVAVSYNNNGGGTWTNIATNASGEAMIPGGQNYVDLRNYSLGTTGWVNTGGADITFYTTAVTSVVKSCITGNVIPGATFRYNPGTTLGGTWVTGSTQELLAGTWYVATDIYGHVRNAQTPSIPGTNTTAGQTLLVTFLTTQVTTGGAGTFYIDPLHDGLYNYYRLGPFTTASVIELLPGSYYFKNGSTSAHYSNGTIVGPYTISGCSIPKIGAEQPALIPTEFGLSQNYPNPFNPSTTITVAVPVDATVSLVVYNTLGQRVAELMNGTVSAGYHDVQFDATNIASGLYIYRMTAKGTDGKDFNKIQKMMLMK